MPKRPTGENPVTRENQENNNLPGEDVNEYGVGQEIVDLLLENASLAEVRNESFAGPSKNALRKLRVKEELRVARETGKYNISQEQADKVVIKGEINYLKQGMFSRVYDFLTGDEAKRIGVDEFVSFPEVVVTAEEGLPGAFLCPDQLGDIRGDLEKIVYIVSKLKIPEGRVREIAQEAALKYAKNGNLDKAQLIVTEFKLPGDLLINPKNVDKESVILSVFRQLKVVHDIDSAIKLMKGYGVTFDELKKNYESDVAAALVEYVKKGSLGGYKRLVPLLGMSFEEALKLPGVETIITRHIYDSLKRDSIDDAASTVKQLFVTTGIPKEKTDQMIIEYFHGQMDAHFKG